MSEECFSNPKYIGNQNELNYIMLLISFTIIIFSPQNAQDNLFNAQNLPVRSNYMISLNTQSVLKSQCVALFDSCVTSISRNLIKLDLMTLQLFFVSVLMLEFGAYSQATIPSKDFTSAQLTLWSGNSIAYTYSNIPYSFPFTMSNAPQNINRVDAFMIGFSLSNTNYFSYYLDVIFLSTSTAMTVLFNPLNSLQVYSLSVSVLATALPSEPYFGVERYQIHPTLLSDPDIVIVNSAESFPSNTTSLFFTHSNFLLRSFISWQIVQSNSSFFRVKTLVTNYTLNSSQFNLYIALSQIPDCSLHQITVVVVIIDYNLVYNNHNFYISNNYKINKNWTGFADATFNDINMTLPQVFGPSFSQNCMAGIIMNAASTAPSSTRIFGFIFPGSIIPTFTTYLIVDSIFMNFQFICMMDCSSDAFYNTSTQQCELCSKYISGCTQCTNSTYCLNCSPLRFNPRTITCQCVGMYTTKNGCTNIRDCIQNHPSGLCVTCRDGFQLSIDYLSCNCPSGLTYVTGYCLNIPGCIAATQFNTVVQCITCDIVKNYKLKDGKCGCGAHYVFDGTYCQAECGDGLVYSTQDCDDGNLSDGDGCSSKRKIQKFYKCVNGSLTHPSNCYYINRDISISLIKTFKNATANVGTFIFKITPLLSTYSKMDFSSLVYFQPSDCQYNQPTITYSNGQIQVDVQFLTDLQTKSVNITLKFNPLFVYHKSIQYEFEAKSQNYPLIVFNNYSYLFSLSDLVLFLTGFAFLAFLMGALSEKMIAIQTIHTFSLVYLSLSFEVASKDTSFSVFSNIRYLFGCFKLFQTQQTSTFSNLSTSLGLGSSQFWQNYFIPLVLFISFSVWCCICKLYKCLKSKVDKRYQCFMGPFENNILYHLIIFPIAFSFLYFYFAATFIFIKETDQQNKNGWISTICQLVTTIFMATILFIEYLLIGTETRLSQIMRPSYFQLYLTNSLIVSLLLCLSFAKLCGIQIITIYQSSYLFFCLFYRPYKSKLNNVGVFINNLTVSITYLFLLLNTLFQISEDTKILVVLVIIILLIVASMISLSRSIYDLCTRGTTFSRILLNIKQKSVKQKMKKNKIKQILQIKPCQERQTKQKKQKQKVNESSQIEDIQGIDNNQTYSQYRYPVSRYDLKMKLQLRQAKQDDSEHLRLERIKEKLRGDFIVKKKKTLKKQLLS